jgi:archaellum component FlaG (FlaF/FlaG flagellin family)
MKKFIITAFIVVSGIIAQAQTTPEVENKKQADIAFDKETHDFGAIPQNIPATYTFTFKNSGKEPLIVTNAVASCGCTTPEWTKEPIMPGKKGFIKATFNAASLGVFNKAVTVMSNGQKGTLTLYIKGDVKAPGEIQPGTKDSKTVN